MSKNLLRFARHNLALTVGLVMLLSMIGLAVCAPYCAPHDPLKIHIGKRMAPISAAHPLGTDYFGRDLLSRIIYGTRYSLTIGVVSIGASLLAGGVLGVLAGYYSRSVGAALIIWLTDITMAFPTYILGAMVAMMFGPGIFNTILALVVAFFPRFIRLARGSTLSAKEDLYVLAARSVGMTDLRLLLIHLVPNIVSPLIVMGVIWMSSAITVEVGLSFLGLGVPPPAPSWGTILQDNLRMFGMDPVKVLWPCLALAWAVQALNLIGDRFRDALDPRMR